MTSVNTCRSLRELSFWEFVGRLVEQGLFARRASSECVNANQQLSLADYRGAHPVVVVFYPKDGSAVCTKEACSFRDAYEDFTEAGAVVIGISSDSAVRHQRFAEKHGLPFLLVSDQEGNAHRAFGVKKTMGFFPGRVTYVIDREDIVRHIFKSQFAADRHVQEALDVVRKLSPQVEMMSVTNGLTCLTGGTGYIGGRLLALLEERGRRVRCLTRRPEALQNRVGPTAEVIRADVLDRDSLSAALDGVETAYYLVHSMGSGDDFEQKDRDASANFAGAAQACGVKRIIYLGGLGDPSHRLSAHLRSRQEVGEILRRSGLQVIEFRASIVIGSGSLSFELIRSLVERLPIMVCPKWVSTPAQPIAIEDVLEYLLGALDLPEGESRVFEIGGPDQVSCGDIMREYARQRGLRRRMISVRVLTPYLSSLWLGLVTPVYARTGRRLIEGLRNPTVVRDASALEAFASRRAGAGGGSAAGSWILEPLTSMYRSRPRSRRFSESGVRRAGILRIGSGDSAA